MDITMSSPLQNRRSQARVSQACQMCKIKKAKCGQTVPCKNCESHGWTCVYEKKPRDAGSRRVMKGSQSQKRQPARDPQTPNSIDFSQEVLGAHRSLSRPSDSPIFNIAKSGERMDYEDDVPSALYTPLQDKEKGQEVSRENRQEIEPLRDVNEHTTGREYYGRSSNFALLGQLFAYARSKLPVSESSVTSHQHPNLLITDTSSKGLMRGSELDSYRGAIKSNTTEKSPLKTNNKLSIINLLYDDETSVIEPNPDSSVITKKKAPQPESLASIRSHLQDRDTVPNEFAVTDSPPGAGFANETKRTAPAHPYRRGTFPTNQASDNFGRSYNELVIEKEYLRVFFTNLYYIHPFLSQTHFVERCEKTIWSRWPLKGIPRGDLHFVALYNVILAIGSLIGSQDAFMAHKKQLDQDSASHSDMSTATSSIHLSKIFLDRSKRLLGDCFEVCSLESAQTLLLMSLYWQNALKPHACYMYSGMAVRTALAIGLPDASMPQSVKWRDSARKTWWAIYSQEVDMCCSSGRMSSLMNPSSYDISFPEISDTSQSNSATSEARHVAIIPEMVKFAALLLRASKEVYHEAKHLSMLEKSKVAFHLDVCFTDWRNELPSWLSPDSNALKEPEWVGKQKLVLELRYQNAKILLHRPFVAASAVQQVPVFGSNIEACLNAARRTISLLYESYLHRHYFRSWRYNTTYTIYAATIILYLILLDYSVVSTEELLDDAQKSLDILASMDEARVARRCFDLIQELLGYAQNHVQQRQRFGRQDTHHTYYSNSLQTFAPRYEIDNGVDANQGFLSPAKSNMNDAPWAMNSSMSEIWASMMDPIALEGFVVSDDPIEDMMYDNSWLEGI